MWHKCVSSNTKTSLRAPHNTAIYLLSSLWENAPAELRAIIVFVASYTDWHPCSVKVVKSVGADVQYIALITLFLQPDILQQGYVAYADIFAQVIGTDLPYTAGQVCVTDDTHLRVPQIHIICLRYQTVKRFLVHVGTARAEQPTRCASSSPSGGET